MSGNSRSRESTPPKGTSAPQSRTSPDLGTPPRASPPRTSPPRTSPPRLSPPRTSPPRQTISPRESTPPPPPGAHAAVYITVYEWTRPLFQGVPRTFMRHSGIVVQADRDVQDFKIYHVIGTPGVGLTYQIVEGWENPQDKSASLLSMEFVAWVPRECLSELGPMFGQVKTQISRSWNCQNWVQEGLQKLVDARLITDQQRSAAVEKQQRAVHRVYEGNTPNRRALD